MAIGMPDVTRLYIPVVFKASNRGIAHHRPIRTQNQPPGLSVSLCGNCTFLNPDLESISDFPPVLIVTCLTPDPDRDLLTGGGGIC